MLSKIQPFQNRNDERKVEDFLKEFLQGASYKCISPAEAMVILGAHLDGESLIHYNASMDKAKGNLRALFNILSEKLTSYPDMILALQFDDTKSAPQRLKSAKAKNNANLENYVDAFVKDYEQNNPSGKVTLKSLCKKYAKKHFKKNLPPESDDETESDEETSETPVICAVVSRQLYGKSGRKCSCCSDRFFACQIKAEEEIETDNVEVPIETDKVEAEGPIKPTAPLDDSFLSREAVDEFDDDTQFLRRLASATENVYPKLNGEKIFEPFPAQEVKVPIKPTETIAPAPSILFPTANIQLKIDRTVSMLGHIESRIKNKSWLNSETESIFNYSCLFFQAQPLSHLLHIYYDVSTYCCFLQTFIPSLDKLPHFAILSHCNGKILKPRLEKLIREVILQHKDEKGDLTPSDPPEEIHFLKVCRAYFIAQRKESLTKPAVLSTNLFRFLGIHIPAFKGIQLEKIANFCRKVEVTSKIKEVREAAYNDLKKLAAPFSTAIAQY